MTGKKNNSRVLLLQCLHIKLETNKKSLVGHVIAISTHAENCISINLV